MNAPQSVGQLDRTTYLGGSDVAAILGVSPWTTPFMLFQKKTGAYVEELTPAKRRILERGARWECIAEFYSARQDAHVEIWGHEINQGGLTR